MNKALSKMRAFTMVELIIVMLIIAIIAMFGVPSFSKIIGRSKARMAINNLMVLHTAQKLYKANNGGYFSGSGLAALNTWLALDLVDSNATYGCDSSGCTATGTNYSVSVGFVAVLGATNPLCTGTYCP